MATNNPSQVRFYNSRYNVAYQRNGSFYLFNTRTGAFLEVPQASVPNIGILPGKEPSAIVLNDIPPNIASDLKRGGFIIPDNYDELQSVMFQSGLHKNDAYKSCSLVILPTTGCNLNCKYCFEQNRPHHKMTIEVQEQILGYLRRRLQDGCKSVYVEWYGGEPLLCHSVIRELSRRLINLCRRHRATYRASMITNGTLLTQSRARELKRLKVGNVQITLDGPREVHDKRRPFVNEKGSYDIILRNILTAYRHLNITIRCNVDKNNLTHVETLCKQLANRGLAPHVRLYVSPVVEGGYTCTDAKRGCTSYFAEKDFAVIESRLKKIIKSHGFKVLSLLDPTHSSCGATALNSFVIDPRGRLFKCSESVGVDEEVVGTTANGLCLNNTLFKWINFSALDYAKCERCKVLPLCMGWCPLKIRSDSSVNSCRRIKFNLIEELKLKHQLHKERRDLC